MKTPFAFETKCTCKKFHTLYTINVPLSCPECGSVWLRFELSTRGLFQMGQHMKDQKLWPRNPLLDFEFTTTWTGGEREPPVGSLKVNALPKTSANVNKLKTGGLAASVARLKRTVPLDVQDPRSSSTLKEVDESLIDKLDEIAEKPLVMESEKAKMPFAANFLPSDAEIVAVGDRYRHLNMRVTIDRLFPSKGLTYNEKSGQFLESMTGFRLPSYYNLVYDELEEKPPDDQVSKLDMMSLAYGLSFHSRSFVSCYLGLNNYYPTGPLLGVPYGEEVM